MGPKNKVSKTPAKRQSTKRARIQHLDELEQEAKIPSLGGSSSEAPVNMSGTIYFWRETEVETGYLSQWYPCDFTDRAGVVYKTAEHYMMYQKAIIFDDLATGSKILQTKHPRAVKGLGRQVKNFDEKTWNQRREQVVREGNYLKFTRAVNETGLRRGHSAQAPVVGESLRALLLSTGSAELVEASPFDRIWGVGFKAQDAERSRASWGLNLLGKALMEVRDRFRKEDEANAVAESRAESPAKDEEA